MPSTAVNENTGEFVFAARASPHDSFVCPECGKSVSYVREHTRQGNTTVKPHFRYRKCNDLGVTVSELSGGGRGGGESDKHKRRKLDAMNAALQKFPNAEANLEMEIGERQADAVIKFGEPHIKYGKGLAIEYQYKNEDKDRIDVQENYAKNEYTTLWLWDAQFDYTAQVPEIELFGGEVYTPWPDAVPKQSEWQGPGYAQKQFNRWKNAYDLGITSAHAPAKTIRHWFIPTQEEYWKKDYKFEIKYRAVDHFAYLPRWKERFPDYGGYKEEHYRAQAAVPKIDTTKRVTANIVAHWVLDKPRTYWIREPWFKRFRDYGAYKHEQFIDVDSEYSTKITYVNEWLLEKPKLLENLFIMPWESKNRIIFDCPNCGGWLKTDPIGSENNRGKRCQHCGEWTTVIADGEFLLSP